MEVVIKEMNLAETCPVIDNFSDGVYARTIFMPAGTIIVGKKHLTRHLNIILSGKARVWMDGEIKDIGAPDILESHEGCRKILYIVEDMYWTTVHATEHKDVDTIEQEIISDDVESLEIQTIIKELKCLGH